MDRRLIALLGFAAALAVVIVVVAVGGGDDDGSASEPGSKPEVEVPDGPPPNELVVDEIEVGDGDEAKAGDRVTVHYVGVDFATGEQFDASWDRGEPFEFQLGSGEVIPGWDQGVEGMKVGGRRRLVIPPQLAYGAQGQPPAIQPNATLVFVIDLLAVE